MTINATGGLVGGNIVFSKAGLTGLSGAATTISTGAGGIAYTIQGKYQASKAQLSGVAVPTIDVVTGAGFKPILADQACVFVFTLDGSGNLGVAQGPLPISPTTTGTQRNVDDNGNYTAPPQFPSIPDSLTPFAYAVIRAQSSVAAAGWVFGSGLWNATGIVIGGVDDIVTLPATPQVS
jgi:hypothetical protein